MKEREEERERETETTLDIVVVIAATIKERKCFIIKTYTKP